MKRLAFLLGGLALPGCVLSASSEVLANSTDQQMTGRYKLSGAVELRPAKISDDGTHTYIVWAPDQALPAVFAVNATGTEEMVDGYMRKDVFTIDRIHQRLVFRIDKKFARAQRIGQ
jgi:type IV secretion system protein VirB9